MQGGGEKKGKKGPFGKNSSNHNNAALRSLAVDTCALRETRRPLPAPPTHTALFFFSSFIDLNSFSASNTRNRPTFSHPLLCGRLIFGHLRSIGDHFWENKAPFQVGGLATRAHLDHQRRSEQGGAAPPLVWAQRVGWGGVELGSPAHQTEKLILQHQYWRGDAEGLVCGCRAQQQLGR